VKVLVDMMIHFRQNLENNLLNLMARFEVFTAVKIEVQVFRVVMPCSVVVGYQHFGGPCCFHLKGLKWSWM